MIATVIKGRFPVLKHCNRTQRVALDWLLERLQSDPGISLRYVSTRDEVPYIFTNAAFQGQQWSRLVSLRTLHPPMRPMEQNKAKGQANLVVLLPGARDALGNLVDYSRVSFSTKTSYDQKSKDR